MPGSPPSAVDDRPAVSADVTPEAPPVAAPSAPAGETPAPESLEIRVRVIDAVTGNGLPGAEVTVMAIRAALNRGAVLAAERGQTSDNGECVIRLRGEGARLSQKYSLHLAAFLEGYTGVWDRLVAPRDLLAGERAFTLELTRDAGRSATLRGVVRNQYGAGVPDCDIVLATAACEMRFLRRKEVMEVIPAQRASMDGSFEFQRLPLGQYQILVFRDGLCCGGSAAGLFKPDKMHEISIGVSEGGMARGRVVDDRGNPVAGYPMTIPRVNGAVRFVSDEAGNFEARHVGEAPYLILSGGTETHDGARVEAPVYGGSDVRITARARRLFRFNVRSSSGMDIPGIGVHVTSVFEKGASGDAVAPIGGQLVELNGATRCFEIRQADPAACRDENGVVLLASLTGFQFKSGGHEPAFVAVAELGDDRVHDVILRMTGCLVTGMLVDSEARPVAGARVLIEAAPAGSVSGGGESGMTWSDSEGVFRMMTSLETGSVAFWGRNLAPKRLTGLRFTAMETLDLETVVLDAGSALEVTLRADRPQEMALLRSPEKDLQLCLQSLAPGDRANVNYAAVDQAGVAKFTGVSAGRYRLALNLPEFGLLDLGEIELTGAATERRDAAMPVLARLYGRLRLPAPAESEIGAARYIANVQAADDAPVAASGAVLRPRDDGTFELLVPGGKYIVNVTRIVMEADGNHVPTIVKSIPVNAPSGESVPCDVEYTP